MRESDGGSLGLPMQSPCRKPAEIHPLPQTLTDSTRMFPSHPQPFSSPLEYRQGDSREQCPCRGKAFRELSEWHKSRLVCLFVWVPGGGRKYSADRSSQSKHRFQ